MVKKKKINLNQKRALIKFKQYFGDLSLNNSAHLPQIKDAVYTYLNKKPNDKLFLIKAE